MTGHAVRVEYGPADARVVARMKRETAVRFVECIAEREGAWLSEQPTVTAWRDVDCPHCSGLGDICVGEEGFMPCGEDCHGEGHS